MRRCVPCARTRVHRWLVCDGAWWRESLWSWCGGTVRGRGLLGGSAKARGATTDLLAALYVPAEQAKQPTVQPLSQVGCPAG